MASAISRLTLSTARSTPFPPKRAASASRSSTASCFPVEAPEGTLATPRAPPSRVTSTSRVGLPRESRTSRAWTRLIDVANFTSWESGVSREQMGEVGRAAGADYGISPLQLMEVAGLATARVARKLIGAPLTGRRVSILAGPGNNGADGLVAGRRLAGWMAEVTVLTSYRLEEARGLSATQLRAATAAGVRVRRWGGKIPGAELLIDALLGFGAGGAPRGTRAPTISP